MTRIAHGTAIIILVLAPLASAIGWAPVLSMVIGFVGSRIMAGIDDIAAWLDGLEAEGL